MQIPKLVAAGALALTVLGVSCGGSGDAPDPGSEGAEPTAQIYDDNGVTFEYPPEWEEFPAKASATTAGSNELWSATVGPDKTNLVNITAYRLNIDVTEDNLDSIEAELDQVIQDVVKQAGGEVTSGPTADEVAGLPGYTYTWEGVEVSGEPKDSSVYFLFDGDIEYFFNCQFSEETADEVQSGCDQILESFSAGETS